MSEKRLQTKVIRFLKEHGAYVIKTKPGMGTPVGCPDVIALFEGNWAAIECKADAKAPYRPGQEATLTYLSHLSRFVYTAHPENWEIIKMELLFDFF